LGPSASARSPSKPDTSRAYPVWTACRPNHRQILRGTAPSATHRSPRPTAVSHGRQLSDPLLSRRKLSKAQDGRMDRRQRLKTSETEPPKDRTRRPTQPKPSGAGPSGRPAPGRHLQRPDEERGVTRSKMFRQNVSPRRPRLRAWPWRPQLPSPKPADRMPSCCRPHRRPSAHRRSW
jgi:hypothetical protein